MNVIPLNRQHEKYLKWKENNIDVLDIIKKHCLKLMSRKKRFSIRMVLHFVRFNEYFEDYRDEPYRICDHHTPYIARELANEHPEIMKYIQINRVEGEEQEDNDEREVLSFSG